MRNRLLPNALPTLFYQLEGSSGGIKQTNVLPLHQQYELAKDKVKILSDIRIENTSMDLYGNVCFIANPPFTMPTTSLSSTLGMKYSEYHKNYPTEKTLENFQSTDSWIDELICELARLADTKFLKNIFGLLNEENISFKFKPTHNLRLDEILTWLNQNISKGRSNRGSQLGWQSGPCSARWPSTNLIDYENTLSMLIPYLI
ncbi:hypothetical protein FQR65_LT16763 [Abscondita terminalis]|nr:hypothetical protein FQR65_LT16763 [Abscondita terminalis]